jgi:hypothetical protein
MAVVEVHPEWCPNGHRLVAGNVTKGWLPCVCVGGRTGHRTLFCWTCRETVYLPPHTP